MRIRQIGEATYTEIEDYLEAMARVQLGDPARENGRAALAAIRPSGSGYLFDSADPAAIAGLRSACESVLNVDGYGSEEALGYASIKRSCRRILGELARR